MGITRRDFVASTAALAATVWSGSVGAEESAPRLRQAQWRGGTPSRVVIDTDPGVDDAFALLLAMRSPELKIEAITAVAGNVPLELTLPNALRMVEIAGRTDIPVAAGAKAPMFRRLVTAAYAHGENGLGGAVFPEPTIKPVAEPASELIRSIVHKYPKEVTLITVGPLTNVAEALNSDTGLASLVRGVVMMGGSAFRRKHNAGGGVQCICGSGGGANRVSVGHSGDDGRSGRDSQDFPDRQARARPSKRPKIRQARRRRRLRVTRSTTIESKAFWWAQHA